MIAADDGTGRDGGNMRFLQRVGQVVFLGAAVYGLLRLTRPAPTHDSLERRRIGHRKPLDHKNCDDPVDLASCDSFPASDPPAYNAGDRVGRPPRS